MYWHFAPQPADMVETEITQRDQFDNDEVNLSETIVREAVQNSLDASESDGSKVKVSFKLVDIKGSPNKEFFKKLFTEQVRHAEAAGINPSKFDFRKPKALVIEDYGTKGLTGSTSEKDEDNFSDFWRRHGKSHKTGKSRGRWGLGKLVYSTSSNVGVFFGLTYRQGDSKPKIMGQTVLNLRKVDEIQYPPHSFFAELLHENDPYKQITIPIESDSFISKFNATFNIQRSSETGLSIAIPFPKQSFSMENMIGVAIENYFYPIITGQLELTFDDITVDSTNIRELAKAHANEKLNQIDELFDFIEGCYHFKTENLTSLKDTWLDNSILDEGDFEEENLLSLRELFSSGELIGIRLPLTVKPKTEPNKKTYFHAFIKKPLDLHKGLDLYVRGGLTVPGESKFRERKAYGAMIAEDEVVCQLLGDAENAAHTQWISNTEKLRKNFRAPQKIVSAIKKSLIQLHDILSESIEERDENALLDFFWIEEESASKKTSKKRRKAVKTDIDIPKLPPRERLFNVSQADGGFCISGAKGLTKEKLPRDIKINIAYEVSKGNAFEKYNKNDFKVGKNGNIDLETNSKIKSAKENTIKVTINKLPFQLVASGFDTNRDVKVKIS